MVEEVWDDVISIVKKPTGHLLPSEFSWSTHKIQHGIPSHKWQHSVPGHQVSLTKITPSKLQSTENQPTLTTTWMEIQPP